MRVLVTGATGYIGSAIVTELGGAGHEVIGLARSESAKRTLAELGVSSRDGSLADLDALRAAASDVDGVIHTAFTNVGPDVDFVAACEADAKAITALGAGLAGSGRPMVITSGTALVNTPGRDATEADAANWGPRAAGEVAALALVDDDVRVSVARLSLSVHDGSADRKGFVPELIEVARRRGASAYLDQGANEWTAVHRLDAARLFRSALEAAPAGSILHGVGDRAIPFRKIADTIGETLGLPSVSIPADDAEQHFGYLSAFIGLDNPSSHRITSGLLEWQPTERGLLEDITTGGYVDVD